LVIIKKALIKRASFVTPSGELKIMHIYIRLKIKENSALKYEMNLKKLKMAYICSKPLAMKKLILIVFVFVLAACSESASERLERENKAFSERVKKINDSLELQIRIEQAKALQKQNK